jgi:hypothetical protein
MVTWGSSGSVAYLPGVAADLDFVVHPCGAVTQYCINIEQVNLIVGDNT